MTADKSSEQGLPTHRSSTGDPAPGIARSSLVDRAGYQNRGAVGYASAAERAQEEVCLALVRDPSLEGARIEVIVEDHGVVLRGTVATGPLRARALAIAQRAAKSCSVRSELTSSERPRRQ